MRSFEGTLSVLLTNFLDELYGYIYRYTNVPFRSLVGTQLASESFPYLNKLLTQLKMPSIESLIDNHIKTELIKQFGKKDGCDLHSRLDYTIGIYEVAGLRNKEFLILHLDIEAELIFEDQKDYNLWKIKHANTFEHMTKLYDASMVRIKNETT